MKCLQCDRKGCNQQIAAVTVRRSVRSWPSLCCACSLRLLPLSRCAAAAAVLIRCTALACFSAALRFPRTALSAVHGVWSHCAALLPQLPAIPSSIHSSMMDERRDRDDGTADGTSRRSGSLRDPNHEATRNAEMDSRRIRGPRENNNTVDRRRRCCRNADPRCGLVLPAAALPLTSVCPSFSVCSLASRSKWRPHCRLHLRGERHAGAWCPQPPG